MRFSTIYDIHTAAARILAQFPKFGNDSRPSASAQGYGGQAVAVPDVLGFEDLSARRAAARQQPMLRAWRRRTPGYGGTWKPLEQTLRVRSSGRLKRIKINQSVSNTYREKSSSPESISGLPPPACIDHLPRQMIDAGFLESGRQQWLAGV